MSNTREEKSSLAFASPYAVADSCRLVAGKHVLDFQLPIVLLGYWRPKDVVGVLHSLLPEPAEGDLVLVLPEKDCKPNLIFKGPSTASLFIDFRGTPLSAVSAPFFVTRAYVEALAKTDIIFHSRTLQISTSTSQLQT